MSTVTARPKKKTIRTIPQARTPAHEQDAKARARNFAEVNCGYLPEDALLEAERCLMCPEQPCVAGCPVNVPIPQFIERIVARDFRGAYDVITSTNLLPAVCGRVCPQENQCEGVCTVGDTLEPVAIGRLERWVGDLAISENWSNVPYIEANEFRVGIVGSGPAGMACAADMAKAGCDVTVFEAFHEPGGVLKYGIPDFRLPNTVVDAEIAKLAALGIKFECNTLVGRLFSIEQMVEEMGFHAVFIGTGAGYPSFMGIRKAGKANIPATPVTDLGVAVGSGQTRWTNIRKPEERTAECVIIEGASAAEKVAKLADALLAEKVI